MVREKIGAVASFKKAVVVGRLPKTRSGKIVRGTMKRIADGRVQGAGDDRRPGDPGRDRQRAEGQGFGRGLDRSRSGIGVRFGSDAAASGAGFASESIAALAHPAGAIAAHAGLLDDRQLGAIGVSRNPFSEMHSHSLWSACCAMVRVGGTLSMPR